jgi:hypothetical protein
MRVVVVGKVRDETEPFIGLCDIWKGNPDHKVIQAVGGSVFPGLHNNLCHECGNRFAFRKAGKSLALGGEPGLRLGECGVPGVDGKAFVDPHDGDVSCAIANAVCERTEASAKDACVLIEEEAQLLSALEMMAEKPVVAMRQIIGVDLTAGFRQLLIGGDVFG